MQLHCACQKLSDSDHCKSDLSMQLLVQVVTSAVPSASYPQQMVFCCPAVAVPMTTRHLILFNCAGVAVSHDGINWLRGDGLVEGHRGSEKAKDVGVVLGPNSDNWWTLDTCHLAVSDVQVCSRFCGTAGCSCLELDSS
jgi:hypothetical protein